MSKEATIHIRCDKEIKEKALRDAKRKMGSSNLTNYIIYLINKEQ